MPATPESTNPDSLSRTPPCKDDAVEMLREGPYDGRPPERRRLRRERGRLRRECHHIRIERGRFLQEGICVSR